MKKYLLNTSKGGASAHTATSLSYIPLLGRDSIIKRKRSIDVQRLRRIKITHVIFKCVS